MFKSVPGNDKYVVSLSQEFRAVDGEIVNIPKRPDGGVELDLYGKTVKVCPAWLSMIAHFEFYLPDASYRCLSRIKFVPNNVKFFRSTCSQLPVFSSPIVVKHNDVDFRIVPNYPNYAVSTKGVLIGVTQKDEVKVHAVNPCAKSAKIQYPVVYVYDPDRTTYRYVALHRLVAMAWVRNPADHFVVKCIVNHKDGNKSNYAAWNLEWCSFSENGVHCFATGLRSDSDKCRVRDFETGKITQFHSKSQAATFMGVEKTALSPSSLHVCKGKLFKNRYEFRLDNDKTDWFYTLGKEKVKSSRYVITVQFKDGSIQEFRDAAAFKKEFKLNNIPSTVGLVKVAKMRYPDTRFTLYDNYRSERVQVYDQKLGQILEAKDISTMSRLTGIDKGTVRRLIIAGEEWTFSGFAFRYKKDTPWCTELKRKDAPRNKPVKATNVITGEEIVYSSYRSAAKAQGIEHRQWLINCIERQVEYKGWRFSRLEMDGEGLVQQ